MSPLTRKASIFLTLLLVLAIAGGVALLVKTKPQPEVKLREARPTLVSLVEVRRETLKPVDRVTGRLEPARRAFLHFQLSGQLFERGVEPGAEVAEGDLLARLDDADFLDELHDAESALAQEKAGIARDRRLLSLARKHVSLAENEVARQRKLGKQSLASQAGLDSARTALLQRQTEVARLEYAINTAKQRIGLKQTALDRARRKLARTRLRAPWTGRVNQVFVDAGDYVTPASRIVELMDIDRLDLLVLTGLNTVRALRPGLKVALEAEERRFDARIRSVQYAPEADTGTYPVRIRVDGAGLTPGMLASVALPLPVRRDALVVPSSALLQDDGRQYLFVFVADKGGDGATGSLRRQPVRAGIRVDGRVRILSGVQAGDRVVARDVAFLADAQRVEARDAK